MPKQTCYMCEKDSTTVEHVPPKCLFPELKDSGRQLRSNLITVPSCDEHNGQKSKEDEFLMVSLAGIIGNNSIGYEHYHGKIQRALKRTAFKLLEEVFLKKKLVKLGDENSYLEILWGTPDHNRLINCFRHIAYGIHFHHYGHKFVGEVKPYLAFVYPNEKNPKTFKSFLKEKVRLELDGKPTHGENQEVFYYQFTDTDQFGLFLCRLKFYQNIDVYISFLPSGYSKPYDIGMELMNSGIKTIFTLGEKKFEFN